MGVDDFFRAMESYRLQRTGDFADLEELQGITFLDVVVVLDGQTAFEVLFDFLRIVFETLERVEFAGIDDHVATQQAQLGGAAHHTRGNHTAGDRTDLADLEHLANLCGTDDFFLLVWRQHARHGQLEVVHGVVNDVVVADVHTVAFGQLARTGIGTGVEANDDGLGGNRQIDIRLTDATAV